MDLVASAEFFPGQCAISRSGEMPLIDTGRWSSTGERIYVSPMMANEIIEAVGGARPEEARELRQKAELLDEVRDALAETSGELERLKNAVSTTLARGAQRDGDGFKLRPKPGEKTVSV